MPGQALSAAAVSLRHGPFRIPVQAGPRRIAAQKNGPMPFHGIISRGLLQEAVSIGPRGVAQWNVVAPFLEQALNILAAKSGQERPNKMRAAMTEGRRALEAIVGRTLPIEERQLVRWLEAARQRAVLSFAQSFQCARAFVERLVTGEATRGWEDLANLVGAGVAAPHRVELWSVREGHTSSVWRVELRGDGWSEPAIFGINVARDRDGGRELLATTREQRRLHAINREGVLGVLGEELIAVPTAAGEATVPVVAVPWVEQARELQVVDAPREVTGRFLIVERFEPRGTLEAYRPRGHLLDAAQSERLWREQLHLRLRLTRFDDDRSATTPFFEINEGDLVWCHGAVKAIGLSEPEPALPWGAWLIRLLLSSTHDGAGGSHRIYWNRPSAAIAIVKEALARGSGPPWAQVVEAARRVGDPLGVPFGMASDGRFGEALRRAKDALSRLAVE
jgi:hypothetical protein